MSNRQLRKLRQYQELQLQKSAGAVTGDKPGKEEEEEADIDLVGRAKPKTSLFAALGGHDDDHDDDDDDGDDDEEQQQQQQRTEEEEVAARDGAAAKSKKKKKKKKPKKDTTAAEATTTEPPADAEDEIDKALKELNIKTPTLSSAATAPGDPLDHVLKINPSHLRPSNEMISMFGRGVVEKAQAQEQAEREAALRERLRRGGQREVDIETYLRGDPREKLPEVSLKRNVFVLGRDHWPRATTGGLTMKAVKEKDGTSSTTTATEYTFAHDVTYEGVQGGFFHFVVIGDPMRIIHLVKQQPYHVSSLLQASNICKQNQDTTFAAELCERALFSFGRVTTSAFRRDLENGTARLDFHRPENRQFWLAGYMWLKSLLQKGTYRTALEWAKLMFSLDRRDPYAMRQFIHVAAVKAEEAAWFLRFVGQDKEAAAAGDPSHVYMAQTKAVAHVQLDSLENARQSIRQGIAKVPWLYTGLFQALHLDLPPSIWGLEPPGDHALWTAFYIHVAKDIWNNAACIGVLREAAGTAPKPPSAVLGDPTPATVSLHMARIVYLEGVPALVSAVPQHYLTMQPNFDFDPLPPPEAANVFTSEASKLPWRYVQANRYGGVPRSAAGGGNPDQAGVAPLEDEEGHHVLFRQYLAGEGRRLLRERAEAARENGEAEEAEDGFMDDENDGEDDDDDDDEPRYSRLEMLGLQAWILQQLSPWTGTGAGGEDGQGQQQQQHQDQGGRSDAEEDEEEERARGDGGGIDGMPGSWPEDEQHM